MDSSEPKYPAPYTTSNPHRSYAPRITNTHPGHRLFSAPIFLRKALSERYRSRGRDDSVISLRLPHDEPVQSSTFNTLCTGRTAQPHFEYNRSTPIRKRLHIGCNPLDKAAYRKSHIAQGIVVTACNGYACCISGNTLRGTGRRRVQIHVVAPIAL